MAKGLVPREIGKIILHCSASDLPTHDHINVITRWHIEERKFKSVGYHFVISKYSGIQIGRPLWEAGAHTKGHNKDSIGICLSGEKIFTDNQIDDAKKLCAMLCFTYGLDHRYIFGHNHFNKDKLCPVFDVGIIRQYVYDTFYGGSNGNGSRSKNR